MPRPTECLRQSWAWVDLLQHHHTPAPGPPPSHPTFGQLRTLQRAKGAWDHVESPLQGGDELPLVGIATRP